MSTNYTLENFQEAWEEWGMNCGPGALSGILNLTPNEVKPHIPQFPKKKYTTHKMMAKALNTLGVPFERLFDNEDATGEENPPMPSVGLIRVQWSGPWDDTPERYRHSHWIAVKNGKVFDFNAINVGGWISWEQWEKTLVPWLLEECEPKWTGRWWPTHCWELIL